MNNINILYNYQPLEQFEIILLAKFRNIPINNSLIYLIFVYLIIRFFFGLVFINNKLVPYNLQTLMEQIYNFVFGLVKQQINVSGYAYFPIIFTLFLFILISNLVGMSLYSFTLTSHVTIAFTLSFSFFIAIIIVLANIKLFMYLHIRIISKHKNISESLINLLVSDGI